MQRPRNPRLRSTHAALPARKTRIPDYSSFRSGLTALPAPILPANTIGQTGTARRIADRRCFNSFIAREIAGNEPAVVPLDGISAWV